MTSEAVAIGYEADGSGGSNGAERTARVWPAVMLVAAFWAVHLALGMIELPLFKRFMGMLFSTGLLLIFFLVWWSLDRRGRKGERLSGVMAWLIAAIVIGALTFKSIGIMLLLLTAMPWVFTAWAAWIVIGRGLPMATRKRGLMAGVGLAGGGVAPFFRGGLGGQGGKVMVCLLVQ